MHAVVTLVLIRAPLWGEDPTRKTTRHQTSVNCNTSRLIFDFAMKCFSGTSDFTGSVLSSR